MTIKNTSLIFLITTIYCLCSCGGDSPLMEEIPVIEPMPEEEILEETNPYPRKFTYSGIEVNPSRFYKFNDNVQIETFEPESGDELLMADSSIFEIFQEEIFEAFPITEIEFLSDTLLRMEATYEDGFTTEDTLTYHQSESNLITIDVWGGLNFDLSENQLKFCYQVRAYTFYNRILEREDVAPIYLEPCVTREFSELLDHVYTKAKTDPEVLFFPDHIIVLNFSSYVLEEE